MKDQQLKKKIEDIITGETQYWQPFGERDSCFIIEEKEPFFWRINPKWANEVADEILALISAEKEKARQEGYAKAGGTILNVLKAKKEAREELLAGAAYIMRVLGANVTKNELEKLLQTLRSKSK